MRLQTRFIPDNYRSEIKTINGQPGILSCVGDVPDSIMTVILKRGKIHQIFITCNPDKLQFRPN